MRPYVDPSVVLSMPAVALTRGGAISAWFTMFD